MTDGKVLGREYSALKKNDLTRALDDLKSRNGAKVIAVTQSKEQSCKIVLNKIVKLWWKCDFLTLTWKSLKKPEFTVAEFSKLAEIKIQK